MSKVLPRPADLFDRETEWRNLSRFVTGGDAELQLGIVWGRRRQGKSYLLQALAEASHGFYYEAFAGTSAELLEDLGDKLARHQGLSAPLRFRTWDDALSALAPPDGGKGSALPLVVLDEFPFLAAAVPALPSLLARLLSPRSSSRTRSRTRLILCGSALRFMVGLLGGSAPLRGRAGLEQVLRPFDFRTARAYWNLRDLRLAVQTFAVLGGTPAYRREMLRGDTPKSLRDFDAWVCRGALNPASALFREGRTLVEEEPQLTDMALYHSVLAAIASGEHKPSSIAGRVGRPLNALGHALSTLSDAGLIERELDAFRQNRSTYAITEPIVAFHHAIMRPAWAELERDRAQSVWSAAKPVFLSKLLGPTFERVCREWVRSFAGPKSRGEGALRVGRGVLADPQAKANHEIDVVAYEGKRVTVLGEAKWSEVPTAATLIRLERVRTLLGARGWDTRECRLLAFVGAATSSRLRAVSQELDTVDLERLYGGE